MSSRTRRAEDKARRLAAEAEVAKLERANPSRKGGITSADVESRIPSADSRMREQKLTLERDAAIARERNAMRQGGGGAPQGGGGAPQGESFAETDARKRRESATSGAFGSKAKNIAQRQGLFAEMKEAVESEDGEYGNFRERASELGIDEAGYKRGATRAAGGAPPSSAQEVAPPLTGRTLTQKNIREMGAIGAAQDFFKRDDAEKAALQVRKNSNFAQKALKTSGEATPSPLSFASMFGEAADKGGSNEPSPAMQAARANTIAARTKADTMRSEYEAGKVRDSKSPKSSRPQPTVAPPDAKPRVPYSNTKYNDEGQKVLTDAEFVDLGAPLKEYGKAFKSSYAEEEAKKMKTPLRSFGIAALRASKAGRKTLIGELTGKR